MKQKHLHLLLGIGGIYLALLTIYLCLAAGVLLVSTLHSMIQMDMFDFQRWSLQNAMSLYIAMALSVLSGLAKLLSGVLGALCLFLPAHRKASSAPGRGALHSAGAGNPVRLALGPSVAAVRPLFDLRLPPAHRLDLAHRLGLEAAGRGKRAGTLPVSARVRPLPRRWKELGLKPFFPPEMPKRNLRSPMAAEISALFIKKSCKSGGIHSRMRPLLQLFLSYSVFKVLSFSPDRIRRPSPPPDRRSVLRSVRAAPEGLLPSAPAPRGEGRATWPRAAAPRSGRTHCR